MEISKENKEKADSHGFLPNRQSEEPYQRYAKAYGDCEAAGEVSAQHRDWRLVGHGKVTNEYCGKFRSLKICDRVELHSQSTLNGVSHSGEVFVHKVHQFCHSPECPVCCLSGWAKREADHIAQRIEAASKRFGQPQHIAISPPEFDWGLAEFHNDKFRLKVKKLLSEVGVVGGCLIFHGFRYANYCEASEKNVLFGWRCHPQKPSF